MGVATTRLKHTAQLFLSSSSAAWSTLSVSDAWCLVLDP